MRDMLQPASDSKRILVVEDDEGIRDVLTFHLGVAGYTVSAVADGQRALVLLQTSAFDVVVLDLVLPGIDGLTLCHTARTSGPNRDVPILMLTARREESDKVLGLKTGADDYLTKPFGVRELLARIEALLRRPSRLHRTAQRTRELPAIALCGVAIEPERRRVTCHGQRVSLTPQEFDLLYLLISHPGVVFDRDELLTRVWSEDVNVTHRGVDALVKRLRRKIERDPHTPSLVLTAWGAGYMFAEPAE